MAAFTRTGSHDGVLVHHRLISFHWPPYPWNVLMSNEEQKRFQVAEMTNGLAAIVGCVAAFASYTFTGQLIPGVF